MKIILLLTLFSIAQFGFGQNVSFRCEMKMTELAEWRPVSATIDLVGNIITVKEVVGIELKIQVDKWQDIPPSRFYSLNYNGQDNVRMAHPVVAGLNGVFIVSVLRDHYQCFKKETE